MMSSSLPMLLRKSSSASQMLTSGYCVCVAVEVEVEVVSVVLVKVVLSKIVSLVVRILVAGIGVDVCIVCRDATNTFVMAGGVGAVIVEILAVMVMVFVLIISTAPPQMTLVGYEFARRSTQL